jgi:tetratricopeptide (TPR) repeat protein
MRSLFLFISILIGASAFAQSDVIINTATLCITEGRYNDAEKYLDSLLKIDPKNIDALMMKGNVLLNYSIMTTPEMQKAITPPDESIYSPDLASLSHSAVIIPRAQAIKIARIWARCIELDSGRLDIREGLCTLYGMADMKKELLDYLPIVARAGRVKGDDFVAVLLQYGQLLMDRDDYTGACDIYRKIVGLYPQLTYPKCQLISAYKSHGEWAQALLYAQDVFASSQADISGCEDALEIYGAWGEYQKQLDILKKNPSADSFPVYAMYEAMYLYDRHDTSWKARMKEYLRQFPTAPQNNLNYSIAAFMLSDNFKEDYAHTLKLLEEFPCTDFCRNLLIDRALADYEDSVQLYLLAAQFATQSTDYEGAHSHFSSIEKKKMSPDQMARYRLGRAFLLYCEEDYAQAMSLLKEDTMSDRTMVKYFLARCYAGTGDKDSAGFYFQEITHSADQSKYAYLAKLQLERMGIK